LSLDVMYSRATGRTSRWHSNDDPRAHACVHAIVPTNNGILDHRECHESIGSGIPAAERQVP
jgi:hypothetical protein